MQAGGERIKDPTGDYTITVTVRLARQSGIFDTFLPLRYQQLTTDKGTSKVRFPPPPLNNPSLKALRQYPPTLFTNAGVPALVLGLESHSEDHPEAHSCRILVGPIICRVGYAGAHVKRLLV